MHAPLNPKFAIAILGVKLPDFLPIEIMAGEVARAGEGVNVLAVRAGRRRGQVSFIVAVMSLARGELPLPALFAVGADAQKQDVVAVLAGEENTIFPNCRRGPAHAGQF